MDLEHGLMLFDKWKQGPFTDTDGTEALNILVWENMGPIFQSLQEVRHLRRFANNCKHYEDATQKAFQDALDVLKRISFAANHRGLDHGLGRIASDYLQTVLCIRCGNYLDGLGNCAACRTNESEEFQTIHQ